MSLEVDDSGLLPADSGSSKLALVVDGLTVFLDGSLADVMIGAGPFMRGHATVNRTCPQEAEGDAPFVATPGILRVAIAGAITLNGLLPLIELWRVAVNDSASFRYAALATAATIALHLRHVIFGLRGERPPAGAWTLAALALVYAAATVLVGRMWAMQFATLALSVLIVVRGQAAVLAVAAIALSPLLLGPTLETWRSDYGLTGALRDWYLVSATVWRTVVLYVPIQLVALIQQLEAARRALESRAVIETRSRIAADLRDGLEFALQRIIADGESAHRVVARDPMRASAELKALVEGSRHALADARRIAAGYRTASLRAEVDAATSLLQAAGSACRLVVTPNVQIDGAGMGSGGAIRAAVVRALQEGDRKVDRVIRVALDETGQLRVEMTP